MEMKVAKKFKTINKIIIFGFSHCGTTILKSIIGHIDEVFEIIDETSIIKINYLKRMFKKNKNCKYILCKFPQFLDSFINDKIYNDYIKIFIIRNPIFVYSSLNKRKEFNIGSHHHISKYLYILKQFFHYTKYPVKNLYTIKYEDLFYNNYQELKKILDSIGFKYSNKIFNNAKYLNKLCEKIKSKKQCQKTSNMDHKLYRQWQINQPFKSNNNISKISLTDEQIEIIKNNEEILKLYPDVKTILK